MKKYYFKGFEHEKDERSGKEEKLMVFERYNNDTDEEDVFSIDIDSDFLNALAEIGEKLPY